MSELQNPVCWGVFARIDGQLVLQPPVEPTEAMAKQAAARFVPGTELEIKPMGVMPDAGAQQQPEPVAWQWRCIDPPQDNPTWKLDTRRPDMEGIECRPLYAQPPAIGAAIREALANLDTVRSSVELGRTGTALARLDDAIALLKGTREGGAR